MKLSNIFEITEEAEEIDTRGSKVSDAELQGELMKEMQGLRADLSRLTKIQQEMRDSMRAFQQRSDKRLEALVKFIMSTQKKEPTGGEK